MSDRVVEASERYFRRRWEDVRGDEHDDWGHSTWYFEVGVDGYPTRQIEVYDAGPVLRYGPEHSDELFGRLGSVRLDEVEDWTPWEISQIAFELAWDRRET